MMKKTIGKIFRKKSNKSKSDDTRSTENDDLPRQSRQDRRQPDSGKALRRSKSIDAAFKYNSPSTETAEVVPPPPTALVTSVSHSWFNRTTKQSTSSAAPTSIITTLSETRGNNGSTSSLKQTASTTTTLDNFNQQANDSFVSNPENENIYNSGTSTANHRGAPPGVEAANMSSQEGSFTPPTGDAFFTRRVPSVVIESSKEFEVEDGDVLDSLEHQATIFQSDSQQNNTHKVSISDNHTIESNTQTQAINANNITNLIEGSLIGCFDDNKESKGDSLIAPTDIPQAIQSYEQIPVLEQTKLPRGGVSIETKAVGRVQFGIPPETIKDSMKLGIPVPQVYIVPIERFCRETGPALGVNLAEFEFPAYFNFFVYKKRCTLVVDSDDAEENIRRVFSETLLGPAQFMRAENPIAYEPEDFDPSFPKDMIPDFQKEFKHFRIMPDGKELVIETLLDFCHFSNHPEGHSDLGVPPSYNAHGEEISRNIEETQLFEDSYYQESRNEICVPSDGKAIDYMQRKKSWTYSKTRFKGDVAVVWPPNASEEQKRDRSVPRVEIFKMPGGTEYIIHDVDVNNFIVGKTRINGHIRVSENLRVDGFGGLSLLDELRPKIRSLSSDDENNDYSKEDLKSETTKYLEAPPPPSFHPPSFGLTILGNSHGFDASGSVSGYVLWINGRGIMIDPPPYSSATLEREGIRPRTIVGIILTHCHADHDAGAFQKVLTGSPVVVITTPTIYKSFIRKYAALSALSPALLRHSHRFKAAIIGQPLRFQGATFKFTYSLHTIPCVGFRVEWRGRSMVFTADHFNSPEAIDKLQETGVLSKGRADDLRNIPLQETDLLLHEAGAPPIHTPLAVLMQLPPEVKKRLYVVHTAKLPDDCDLRAAPTGTAGTLRLDSHIYNVKSGFKPVNRSTFHLEQNSMYTTNEQEEYHTVPGESSLSSMEELLPTTRRSSKVRSSVLAGSCMGSDGPPLVALRPSSSTDAWFILNLLSAVPFISSLSYTSTLELLETAQVDAYRQNDVVISYTRRTQVLCVVWEGTCSEKISTKLSSQSIQRESSDKLAVWHAGDWTGPLSLQPEQVLSGESKNSLSHDIVAVSYEGVKVITIEFSKLHTILTNGSGLYRRYLQRTPMLERALTDHSNSLYEGRVGHGKSSKKLNVLELLNYNSALRKLSAVQKRHLESLAEGPVHFLPNERMWQAGARVDRAYIIVSGTASFHVRKNAVAVTDHNPKPMDFAESVRMDAMKVMKELDRISQGHASGSDDHSDVSSIDDEVRHFSMELFGAGTSASSTQASSYTTQDVDVVAKGLFARANKVKSREISQAAQGDNNHDPGHPSAIMEDDSEVMSRRPSDSKRMSRSRFTNKVLGRLYNRRAFTSGLVFSRGHFLGDVSKMVEGLMAADDQSEYSVEGTADSGPSYAFPEKFESDDEKFKRSLFNETIHEQDDDILTLHSSTLTAGKDGCVALVFPKASLIPLLDIYPGLLLSLLGTQVVV